MSALSRESLLRGLVDEAGRLRRTRLASLEQAHWKEWIARRLARRDPVFANASAAEEPESRVDLFQELFKEELPAVVTERARGAVRELVADVPAPSVLSDELRALLRLALVVRAREVRAEVAGWLSADGLDPELAAALLIGLGHLSAPGDDDAPFRQWFARDLHAAHAFVGLARTGSWRPEDIIRLVHLAHAAAAEKRPFALTPTLCALFQASPMGVARDALWAALRDGTAFGDRAATWRQIARRVAHFGYKLPDADHMQALASRPAQPQARPRAQPCGSWQVPLERARLELAV